MLNLWAGFIKLFPIINLEINILELIGEYDIALIPNRISNGFLCFYFAIYILAKESAGIERRGGVLDNNKDDGSKKIYITVLIYYCPVPLFSFLFDGIFFNKTCLVSSATLAYTSIAGGQSQPSISNPIYKRSINVKNGNS